MTAEEAREKSLKFYDKEYDDVMEVINIAAERGLFSVIYPKKVSDITKERLQVINFTVITTGVNSIISW